MLCQLYKRFQKVIRHILGVQINQWLVKLSSPCATSHPASPFCCCWLQAGEHKRSTVQFSCFVFTSPPWYLLLTSARENTYVNLFILWPFPYYYSASLSALLAWDICQLGTRNPDSSPVELWDGAGCWHSGSAMSPGPLDTHRWHQATQYKHARQNEPERKDLKRACAWRGTFNFCKAGSYKELTQVSGRRKQDCQCALVWLTVLSWLIVETESNTDGQEWKLSFLGNENEWWLPSS